MQNHHENCRKRIEDAILKTQEGRSRVDRSNTRINECIANQIEQEGKERQHKKIISKKSDPQRHTVQQEADREQEPKGTDNHIQNRGESSTTVNTHMKGTIEEDESPVQHKDRSTEVRPR